MGRVFHARQALLGIALALGMGLATFAAGCSSSACDCGTDGVCVNDGTGARCYAACSRPGECPANFHCAPTSDGASTGYCASDRLTYTTTDPSGGRRARGAPRASRATASRAAHAWITALCHAERPTDASAYCAVRLRDGRGLRRRLLLRAHQQRPQLDDDDAQLRRSDAHGVLEAHLLHAVPGRRRVRADRRRRRSASPETTGRGSAPSLATRTRCRTDANASPPVRPTVTV